MTRHQQSLWVLLDRDVVVLQGIELRRRRTHEGMHAKEDEVIQLTRNLDTAHDSVFFRETFSSFEKLLIFIAVGFDQWCKAEERARIVRLTLTRERNPSGAELYRALRLPNEPLQACLQIVAFTYTFRGYNARAARL